ncbi:MAG: TetR/AcrR family transcriptional regulator [Candidatus Cloacimonadota bacterium]|nr:TetR/AcrR family transcriptional regulator [Candidatus Cloacimonadota bacterium]
MNSKDKISLAALKIFLQKGYDATSISDVVAECKITKGGIYHHFKNKEELFIEAIDYLFERFEEFERSMYSESTNLKQILQTYFGSLSHISEMLGIMTDSENIDVNNFYMLMTNAFIKFPQIRKKHGELHLKSQEILVEIIKNAQREGQVKDNIDCGTMGFMINALAEGTMMYHIMTDGIDLKEKGEKIFQNLWKGISTENEV